MDGISSVSTSTTPVQIGKATVLKLNNAAQKYDKPVDINTDEWQRISRDPKELRASSRWSFNEAGIYPNRELQAVSNAVNQERDQAINQFLDGKLSQEELSNTFQKLLTQFRDACNEIGYPSSAFGLSASDDEAMTEVFYSGFRARVLELAVDRNNEEGKQYITGEMNSGRNWKYYNSDYYFKSEDALSAVENGLKQYLAGRGENFTVDIPDYKAKGMDGHYNFNSAWSAYFVDVGWRGEADQFMRDYDQAPPANFQWFYQSGGENVAKVVVLKSEIEHADGTSEVLYEKKWDHFDPKDSHTATTWAAYQDENGTRHVVGTDFFYDFTVNDRKSVSSLLSFSSNGKMDAAVNKFMGSLQVCSKAYYRRHGLVKGIDLQT